jgi:hypothetical protein
MSTTQSDKAARFKALHQGAGAFIIPNPWDAGSARLLAGIGFAALATSSGASAGVLGRRDGKLTRDEAPRAARAIVDATDLPVSADLRRVSEIRRMRRQRRSVLPLRLAWWAARSRMQPGIRTSRSSISDTLPNASRRQRRRRGSFLFCLS